MYSINSRLLAASALAILTATSIAQRKARTPVLVELFTSEGCSSCPPADALLQKLDHDQPIEAADIIVLGEHVDYWDVLGWHDRFSSHQYTDRQSGYSNRFNLNSSYTPQMVVDGTEQFVGNDVTRARQAIEHAARAPKLTLTLSPPVTTGRRLSANVTAPVSDLQADLYAALVEPRAVTEVRRGENSGRRLQHAGVVRTLQRIGTLRELGTTPRTVTFDAPEGTDIATLRIVVFAQKPNQGQILAATASPIHP